MAIASIGMKTDRTKLSFQEDDVWSISSDTLLGGCGTREVIDLFRFFFLGSQLSSQILLFHHLLSYGRVPAP